MIRLFFRLTFSLVIGWTIVILLNSTLQAATRPNIIFIITDDQKEDDFGFMGGRTLSPNIDRLATEGMYFRRAYTATSVCTPSRYTCLTGRYPSECLSGGLVNNTTKDNVTRVAWNTTLEANRGSLPRALQAAGYVTGAVGKWHLGQRYDFTNVPPGSDPYDPKINAILLQNQVNLCNAIKEFGFDDARSIYVSNIYGDRALKNCGIALHNMEWIAKGACEFIEENKDKPFYLYCATTLTHDPDFVKSIQADPRISGEGILEKPITGLMESRESLIARTKAAGYPAENVAGAWLDAGIGAIMKKVEDAGIADNTLIIYFNDHGMEQNSKGTLYEGGIKTPTFAYWPGKVKSQVCDKLVQNIDFVSTVLDVDIQYG